MNTLKQFMLFRTSHFVKEMVISVICNIRKHIKDSSFIYITMISYLSILLVSWLLTFKFLWIIQNAQDFKKEKFELKSCLGPRQISKCWFRLTTGIRYIWRREIWYLILNVRDFLLQYVLQCFSYDFLLLKFYWFNKTNTEYIHSSIICQIIVITNVFAFLFVGKKDNIRLFLKNKSVHFKYI